MKRFYGFICLFAGLLAFQQQAAEPIRMGLHLSAPWSFYNDAGELDGIEYQLVSRIFSRAGFKVEYELHSYSRLLKQLSDKKLDCASPVAIPVEGASYTEPYLPFEDVVISLASSGIEIQSLQQLAGKRIVAYQQAQQRQQTQQATPQQLSNEPQQQPLEAARKVEEAEEAKEAEVPWELEK